MDWVDKGYFNAGFNGQDYDPAWQGFTKGQGLFLIAGSWLQADLSSAMKTDVKFMLPPAPEAGGTPVTTGGSGLPVRDHAEGEEQGRRRGIHQLHHQPRRR